MLRIALVRWWIRFWMFLGLKLKAFESKYAVNILSGCSFGLHAILKEKIEVNVTTQTRFSAPFSHYAENSHDRVA